MTAVPSSLVWMKRYPTRMVPTQRASQLGIRSRARPPWGDEQEIAETCNRLVKNATGHGVLGNGVRSGL